MNKNKFNELYQDPAHRLDTLAGPENAAYWRMLARLSDEYAPEHETDNVFGMPKEWPRFSEWCEQNHGFRVEYDDRGGIIGRPTVVDEQKYTLCLLKYSG